MVEQKNQSKTVMRRSDFSVMIIDDDKQIAELLSHKLKQKNINTILASNGEEALTALTQAIPSLIILDIMMPKVGGHETLHTLKKNPNFANIPVMMMTSQTEQKDVVSALYSGAVDYVVKPIDPDQMLVRIEKILNATLYSILVVDNDQLMLQLTGNRFREKGFNVTMLDDGKKAWDYIIKHLPDVVILDRMMPGLEGFAVLSNMRNEKSTQNIPVLIVSARKEEKDIAQAKKLGANAYIAKPFILDDLIEQTLKIIGDATKFK